MFSGFGVVVGAWRTFATRIGGGSGCCCARGVAASRSVARASAASTYARAVVASARAVACYTCIVGRRATGVLTRRQVGVTA